MLQEQFHWQVVYTNPRAEKRVFEALQKKGITAFLPLIKKLQQWSDRKKWIEIPLFNSYVFVYVSSKEYDEVLKIPGIVKYITHNGKAARVREVVIENIRKLLASEDELEISNEHFVAGDKVRIKAGPLLGMTGELLNINSSNRFIIRFEELGKSIIINIAPVYLEPVF